MSTAAERRRFSDQKELGRGLVVGGGPQREAGGLRQESSDAGSIAASSAS
ncbi:MAG: hypothetical protein QF723_07255 [Phycisphaerales bacterium]|jgi:hypothetical protein|nr:hypothetical protein [Phycisphaerales bacterium]MDP7189980.1 hypothetical protein [Phycisphaerales bacterium]MDP7519857.1 hypothetical protein [Phycisphaerales bacterium]MDP7574889.1 hypothetical protein [Phycisphaerales bacterium]HJN80380.1 hypothetical protein [Phycisphaerales bacterium]|tara:strand:- start:1787 stop:1936 length:150 start_codon:yes stop_codon:yes gene_type:complete